MASFEEKYKVNGSYNSKNQYNETTEEVPLVTNPRQPLATPITHSGSLPNVQIKGSKNSLTDDRKSLFCRKLRIYKNIWVCNIAYLCMFTSLVGMSIIQSSLVGAVGTAGLAANFAASILGCSALAPLIVRVAGCRVAMVLGFCAFFAYMASHAYPVAASILPGSVISGLLFGPLFTAQGTYFTAQGNKLSRLTGESAESILGRLFGLFFFLLLLGTSFGCLLTSVILDEGQNVVVAEIANSTLITDAISEAPLCGYNYCPIESIPLESATTLHNISYSSNSSGVENLLSSSDLPSQFRIYLLVGVHSSLPLIAAFLVIILVDSLPKEDDSQTACQVAKSSILLTVKQLIRPRQILMAPLNIYSGMTQSFVLADITGAWIACSLGVHYVGYALITYGISACLSALFGGLLVKHTGRVPLFSFIFLLRLATHITLFVWMPEADQVWAFFLLPGVWAFVDGFFMSQLNAMYGIIFADNASGAFATYRFYESIGLTIGYIYNSLLCVKVKMYILSSVLALGIVGYYATEIIQRKRNYRQVPTNEKEETLEVKNLSQR